MATSRSWGSRWWDLLAVDADLARGDLLEPGDHAQGRGLAAAGWPDEDHELAVLDPEA